MSLMWRTALLLMACVALNQMLVCASPAKSRLTVKTLLLQDLLEERCDGEATLRMCTACSEATINDDALRFCCGNQFGVRKWCKEYLDFTLERR